MKSPKKKGEKPFYKSVGTIIFTGITLIGLILGLITNGFQVWDKFKFQQTTANAPIIDIRVDPFEFNYNNFESFKNGKITFTIQTSKGSYQILDSLKFEKIIVIKPDFFKNKGVNATSILTEVTLDYMILDNRIPEEIGLLKFKNNFDLKKDKLMELAATNQKETIGMIIFRVPYKYENNVYILKKYIPIIASNEIQ